MTSKKHSLMVCAWCLVKPSTSSLLTNESESKCDDGGAVVVWKISELKRRSWVVRRSGFACIQHRNMEAAPTTDIHQTFVHHCAAWPTWMDLEIQGINSNWSRVTGINLFYFNLCIARFDWGELLFEQSTWICLLLQDSTQMSSLDSKSSRLLPHIVTSSTTTSLPSMFSASKLTDTFTARTQRSIERLCMENKELEKRLQILRKQSSKDFDKK